MRHRYLALLAFLLAIFALCSEDVLAGGSYDNVLAFSGSISSMRWRKPAFAFTSNQLCSSLHRKHWSGLRLFLFRRKKNGLTLAASADKGDDMESSLFSETSTEAIIFESNQRFIISNNIVSKTDSKQSEANQKQEDKANGMKSNKENIKHTNYWKQQFPDPEMNAWRDSWKGATPQRTIYSQGLSRDRWVRFDAAVDVRKWDFPALIKTLSDPSAGTHTLYSTFRTIFFYLMFIPNGLLQGDAFSNLLGWFTNTNNSSANNTSPEERAAALARLFASIAELYRRDYNNIAAGAYRAPYDASPDHRQFDPLYVADSVIRMLRNSADGTALRARGPAGFTQARSLAHRAAAAFAATATPGLNSAPGAGFGGRASPPASFKWQAGTRTAPPVALPRYYLQNFHWQPDGWLSDRSARAYECSTETLFSGCQDAMQRQGLLPIADYVRRATRTAASAPGPGAGGSDSDVPVSARRNRQLENERPVGPLRSESELRLLEVACGTGRLHTFIKDNWPQMQTVASDLSLYYLRRAADNLAYHAAFSARRGQPAPTPARLVQCAAEALPFAAGEFDILSCTYLFHEIPLPVRRAAAREMFRVLAPGGIAVLTDSIQQGDRPEIDPVGDIFPAWYHEPFYRSYFRDTDLVALFQEAGFAFRSHSLAHFSKVLTFEKPVPQ